MRKARKNSAYFAAPLALLALSACSGDTEGTVAEGDYDPDAPSLEEVSRDAELANETASDEGMATNTEVAE